MKKLRTEAITPKLSYDAVRQLIGEENLDKPLFVQTQAAHESLDARSKEVPSMMAVPASTQVMVHMSDADQTIVRSKKSSASVPRKIQDAVLLTCEPIGGTACMTSRELFDSCDDVVDDKTSVPIVARIPLTTEQMNKLEELGRKRMKRKNREIKRNHPGHSLISNPFDAVDDPLHGAFYRCAYVQKVVTKPDCVILVLSTFSDESGLTPSEYRSIAISNYVQNAVFAIIGILFGAVIANFIRPGVFDEIKETAVIGTDPIAIIASVVAGLLCSIGLACGLSLYQRWRYEDDETEKRRQRRGVYGEIVSISPIRNILFMSATGIGEELLFRFGFVTFAAACLMAMGVDALLAGMLAVGFVSLLFSAAHFSSYEHVNEFVALFFMSMILGCVFIGTGSIIAAMMVHAAYDYVTVSVQHRKLMENQYLYFGGRKPVALVTEAKSSVSTSEQFLIV